MQWVLGRPSRSMWICGLAGLSLAAVITIAGSFPPAQVHDELAYLLAGDTFADGRVSYPTHPMWRHFETFHVLMRPTYVSKYPPAQGLAIALGQRLTGTPLVGIWISCALLVAGLNWMLQAWTRPRWAFWGAIAAALWISGWHATGYWTTSFWGGSVAAFGGALVLGGIRRLASAPTVTASIAVGAGLAVLANSRPFEGLLFSLPSMAVVAWVLFRQLRVKSWRFATITIAPMALVLAITGALMGLYNFKTTGSATQPPYLAYDRQYAFYPNLIGQDMPPPPVYRVAVMEQFYHTGVEPPPQNFRQYAGRMRENASRLVEFYAPWFIVPLLFVLPMTLRGLWMQVALASIVTTGIALALNLYFLQPHYAAPLAAAWCLLLTQAARFASHLRLNRARSGRVLVHVIMACLVGSVFIRIGVSRIWLANRKTTWSWERQSMERSLSSNGEHLVIVEYGPMHSPNYEWVYNRGNIDAAPVVWARSLGVPEDAALRQYFADRRAWRLRIDDDSGPFKLMPLEGDTSDSIRQAVRP